jgi:ribose 5-phosphate isomerase B
MIRIYLGADHRGFKIKEKLRVWLESEGYEVMDKGNMRYDPEDDFPDFALKVAEEVSKGNRVGILLCGSGGMAVVANKVKGIRAVEVYDEEGAEHAKSDDRANVLALPADAIDIDKAKKIVNAWLKASFKTDTKYLRRIRKIDEIEHKYFKRD